MNRLLRKLWRSGPLDDADPVAGASTSQKVEITNTTSSILEIMIEPYPDRYLLRPGDEMVIEADLCGAPLSIHPFDGGLQIYPGHDIGSPVTINGAPAEPDWETKA